MRVRVCYKSGRVEEWNDVDMVHDGRSGLTVIHRGGVLHLRRTEVTTVEITMSAEARKPAVLVEAAPYSGRGNSGATLGRLIRMDRACGLVDVALRKARCVGDRTVRYSRARRRRDCL